MLYDFEKRNLGLNFTTATSVKAQVWSPFAQSLKLVTGNREIVLDKKDYGYWESEIMDVAQGDLYKFVVDGKQYPDPASLSQPEGVHGPSAMIDLNTFVWTDSKWKGVLPEDLILYELHTGTFTPSGTFAGIEEKIGYLKDLGITAVELMPVAQFPGTRNWGYDGVYLFAVQQSYGGPFRLQKLVDMFHNENIAVVLDVVYNHLGPEGNYLPAYGPYFTDKYHTPWGKAVNFDDEWCDGVRRFVIENALMWFRDFHIDALRLDAVHAIRDFGAKHILAELRENVDLLNEKTGVSHLIIAETDLNDVRYINPFDKGGYGVDIQWNDEFHHSIHSLVTAEKTGYYFDFGTIENLSKAFTDAYVYDGIYSEGRKKTFGNKTTGLPGSKFIVFSQNHDQTGNRLKGDRLSTLVDIETLKLIAGTIFLSPYVPLIFMGEEYGETNPFLYFIDHGDKDLIEAVRKGRKQEFSYHGDMADFPDPQSEETYEKSKLTWDNHNEQQEAILHFYKELISLRKSHPVLKNLERAGMEASIADEHKTIILLRQFHENHVLCIFNFEDAPVTLELAHKDPLLLLLDSSGENWNENRNISLDSKDVQVAPRSFKLLSDSKS